MSWDLRGKRAADSVATTEDPTEPKQLVVDAEGNELLRGILDQLLILNAYMAAIRGAPITSKEANKYLG